MARARILIIAFVVWGLVGLAAPVGATPPEQVPVSAEFSTLELAVIGANLVIGPAVLLVGPRFVRQQPTVLTPPGDESLDYRVSQAWHGDLETGDRVAGGVADPVLLAAPWVALLFYGTSTAVSALGDPWLGQRNVAHSALAYAEALGWTSLLVGAARLIVRRDRPWVALDRPQFARSSIEETTSLASSHTALGATFASFVALDLSGRLLHRENAGWFVGRVLPFLIPFSFVGAASVAHIVDQENFVTDELLGLAIGTGSGALAWAIHFDRTGQPRGRQRFAVSPVLTGEGIGLGWRGQFGQ